MTEGFHQIQLKNAVLSYLKAGTGPKPILTFHGFGQDNTVFNPLVDELGDRFTFYSFDLFFHGQSKWLSGETPLSKTQWKEILEEFIKVNNLEKFALLGFSLGGKFALSALEAFPTRITSLILIAPDGIKTNFWYSLATYPIALRAIFKSLIHRPKRFDKIVKLAGFFRIIDKGVLRFVESQMNTSEKRSRVYYSWVVFRHLRFNVKSLASHVNQNQIELHLFMGKFDKIITTKNMDALLTKVPDHKLHILDAGHNNLISKSISAIRNIAAKRI